MTTFYNSYKPTPLPTGWGKGAGGGPIVLSDERKAELVAQAESVAAKLVDYAFDTEKFPSASTSQGVSISSVKAANGELFLVRGTAVFKGSIDMLRNWRAADTSGHYCTIMSRVDPAFVCGRTIAHVAGRPTTRDGGFNVREAPELPFLALRWPVWKRDIVHIEYNAMLEGGIFVQASQSVVLPECPSLEDAEIAVRAELGPSGYVWRELKGGLVQLTYCVQLDAKGSIPNWVQNAVAPQQGLNCARIRDSLLQLSLAKEELDKAGGTLDTISLALDVAAGSEHTVDIPMQKGQQLEWEFVVKEKDMGLRLVGAEEKWATMTRYKAGTLHRGVATCAGASITMCWDNTYSRFTAKTLYGRHRLVPTEAEKAARAKAAEDAAAGASDAGTVESAATGGGAAGAGAAGAGSGAGAGAPTA